MEGVLHTNIRIHCDICGGRYTYTNRHNHNNTILYKNAIIKAQAEARAIVQPVSSIECDICLGHYWESSKKQHKATNKHIRAQIVKLANMNAV